LAVSESLDYDTYNICSSTSRAGKDILEMILTETGLNSKVAIEVDKSLIRPSDPPELYGSYERLQEETGWSPVVPFEKTIKDFIAST
jgi:GDP-4-dehydro-6-deoxy-D-mannose reductase